MNNLKYCHSSDRNFNSGPPEYAAFVLNSKLHVHCYGKHFKDVVLKAL